MTQLTYYPTPQTERPPLDMSDEPGAGLPETERPDAIRFGYTLDDLDHITRIAIMWRSAYRARDADERYACGWHAAVELLLTATSPPRRNALIAAAQQAADHLTLRVHEDAGIPRFRADARSTGMPRFCAYWETVSRHTAGPEDQVVERVALWQVWARLRPAEQEALQTLAAMEDYQAAADALGLPYHRFYKRIRRARARFYALWLEGETPRRGWRDRRVKSPGWERVTASAYIRRRAREVRG